jgi:hypothetical protein
MSGFLSRLARPKLFDVQSPTCSLGQSWASRLLASDRDGSSVVGAALIATDSALIFVQPWSGSR